MVLKHRMWPFDNFYTSIPLTESLLDKTIALIVSYTFSNYSILISNSWILKKSFTEIYCVGTVRPNRKSFPKRLFKSLSRGQFDSFVNKNNSTAFKWKDRRDVYLLSSCHSAIDKTKINSKQKDGSFKSIDCPKAIRDYREHMGGVDRHDRYSSMYLCDSKCLKYWHRIFFRIIESCLVNSYICYIKKHDRISFFDCKSSVAISLLKSIN